MSRGRRRGSFNRATGLPRGSGSVEVTRAGRFQARPGKGQPSLGTFDTEDEAIEALRAHLLVPAQQAAEMRSVTLEDYITHFCKLKAVGWSRRTEENYRWYADRKINPSIGHVPVSQIDQQVIEEWWIELTADTGKIRNGKRTDGATTCAKVWKFLRQVLRHAHTNNITSHAPRDPVAGATKENAPERHLLTDAQFVALLDGLPPERRIVAILAGTCGLRFGEIAALRRHHIDLEHGVIGVREAVCEDARTGTKSVKPPKSKAGTRNIPLSDSTRQAIEDHLDAFVPDQATDALLVSTSNGTFLSRNTWGQQWRRARTEAGLDYITPAVTVHDLRHYCLTNVARHTNLILEIKRFAGHSSVAAALRYQHATSEDLTHLALPVPSPPTS